MKTLRKQAYLLFRKRNPHISANSMWAYIRVLDNSGQLKKAMKGA